MEPAIAAAGMKRTPTRRLLASAGCSRIRMMRTQERRGREKDVHVSLQRDTRGERRARKSKREDLRERLDHPVRPRDRASDSMPLQAAATLTFKLRDARSRICTSPCSATREASGARARSRREDLRERLDHPVRPRDHASDSMPLQAAATLTFECAMRAAGSARQPAARHERRAARARHRSEKTFVSVSIIPFARASHQHALRHPL